MTDVTFWINDEKITTDAPAGLLILDYLRKERYLTGTKEGCKEGDCGACSVLVGELVDGQLLYRPVTSCLLPLGEMHGRHIVSIEGLNLKNHLNPVQQTMVDRCGSQCGFCTPGFIISMSWYLLTASEEPSLKGFQRAFSGNLCRCTGYISINRASQDLVDQFGPGGKHHHIWQAQNRINAMADAGLLPAYFKHIPARLADIAPLDESPLDGTREAQFFVAGGTDLYVQQGEHLPRTKVKILNRHPEMKGVTRDDNAGLFRIGALTTFEEFGQHPEIRRIMPRAEHYLYLIASLPLRLRASLSGNIINASPIGDLSNLLLAIDSTLIFATDEGSRAVPMKDFYKGYKTYDKHPHEIMTEIHFPIPDEHTKIHFEKVSKRKCLDIATCNSGARLKISPDGIIQYASLTAGGVAPTPLWLKATGEFLQHTPLNHDTLLQALRIAQSEISPISDVRGSADYKRLLINQLITSHFVELYPQFISPNVLLAS